MKSLNEFYSEYSIYLKFFFSLISVWLLYIIIDFDKILLIVKEAKLNLLCIAILLILIRQVIQSFRFYEILRNANCSIGITKIAKHYFIGYFYNFFLPSSIGGDVARLVLMTKEGYKKNEIGNLILLERFTGFFSLSIIALWGLSIYNIKGINPYWIYGLTCLFVLVLILFVTIRKSTFFKPISTWFKVFDAISLRSFSYIFFLSFIFQVFSIFIRYFLGLTFNIQVEFEYYLLFIPLINIVTLIPISINGFGTREAAFIFLFGLVGLGNEEATVLSFSSYIMMLFLGIIGAFFSIRGNLKAINI